VRLEDDGGEETSGMKGSGRKAYLEQDDHRQEEQVEVVVVEILVKRKEV
jgi:hypothetical protein